MVASNNLTSLELWGKADAGSTYGAASTPPFKEMNMHEVLFNFIFLFFAVSGFLAWAFILFLCILYFFINRDLDFFETDRERLG